MNIFGRKSSGKLHVKTTWLIIIHTMLLLTITRSLELNGNAKLDDFKQFVSKRVYKTRHAVKIHARTVYHIITYHPDQINNNFK